MYVVVRSANYLSWNYVDDNVLLRCILSSYTFDRISYIVRVMLSIGLANGLMAVDLDCQHKSKVLIN